MTPHRQRARDLGRLTILALFAILTIAAWPIEAAEVLALLWLAGLIAIAAILHDALRRPVTPAERECDRIDQSLDADEARRRRVQERRAAADTRPSGHVAQVIPLYGRMRVVDRDETGSVA